MTRMAMAGVVFLTLWAAGCEEDPPPDPAANGGDVDASIGDDLGAAADSMRPTPDAAPTPDAMSPTPDAAAPMPDAMAVDAAPDPDASACVPGEEVCDGEDNDCDGLADEGITPVVCYDGPPGSDGVGRCRAGRDECIGGRRQGCRGQVLPAGIDECNDGQDNDCDGSVDEGCECSDGDVQPCGSDVGACQPGEQRCVNAMWGACEGGVGPMDEICDGLDNDCDGAADGFTEPCYDGPEGSAGVGACRAGERACADGAFGACVGEVRPAAGDDCGGGDEDCDGSVDEDFEVGDIRCGVGACAAVGRSACVDGEPEDDCEPGQPADEDGCSGVDDDCDGEVDEDFEEAEISCGIGACVAEGRTACEGGEVVEVACVPGEPRAEVADEVDRDCDGRVDEGFAFSQEALQSRIDRECGGCHGRSGGLTLRGDFLANTVNQQALGAPMNLLTPGDPGQSYLYYKLAGTQGMAGGGGGRMPRGGPFWEAWELERFALWIEGFAP